MSSVDAALPGQPGRQHAFQILGPLTIVDGYDSVVLPPSKPTVLLATLLLNANNVVYTEKLRQAVWDDEQPAGARAALQTCVLRLRQLFGKYGIANTAIETVAGGYRMVADARTLDLVHFRELVQRAADPGEPEERLQLLDHALALWHGPPLVNVPSEVLRHDAVPRLTEERLRAVERASELRMALGQAGAALPGLWNAARTYPGHERISEQLAEALYRTGRQADALAEIRRIKDYLRTELGVDPGRSLGQLEIAILRGEELGRPYRDDRPRTFVNGSAGTGHLPFVPQFAGRAGVGAAILDQLAPDRPGHGPIVVTGPAGIGKTALALQVARLAGERGAGVPGLVRATGPDGTPRSADEIAADLRAVLDRVRPNRTRRALVVLDDVGGPEQIPGPLLEWDPERAVIITSRMSLAGLVARHGARVHRLDVLDPDESDELLCALLGTARAGAEPTALRALADACGHFPLSLRIAGARLLTRPRMRIEDAVAWLAQDRIDRLALPDDPQMSVVHRLRGWLDQLDPPLVDAFVRVGSTAPPVFGTESGAAVLGTTPAAAEQLLDRLVDANLLEEGSGHYTMHELLRIFARSAARPVS
ncbi:winged helix-turn-helix domain-containing protein [Micromonospora sp. NBC_01699]|uniref:BTAD domain-containing putative transcriptional regulator n=1 Tax=Micromonospora sp. NBC_01699 TaxID=2975984 RepID=UPI002E27C502|nr:BTAD domain-containing putative transcriptional regulator [Micromonospora sp. NBC_01699]